MAWLLLIMLAFLILLILSLIAKTRNKVINAFFLVGFFGTLIYLGISEYKFYTNEIQIWRKYFNYIYLPIFTDSTEQYYLDNYYRDMSISNEYELEMEFNDYLKLQFNNKDIMYVDKDSTYVKYKTNDSDQYSYFTIDGSFYNYIDKLW